VIVSGEIIKPFPDRPTEGILQFSADMCLAAEVSTLAVPCAVLDLVNLT
jgi:exosome complex RNA-binding protein Rrp42 (RNase PH superfamily)